MKVFLEQPKTLLYIFVMNFETGQKVLDNEGMPYCFFDVNFAKEYCVKKGWEVMDIRGGFEGPHNPNFDSAEKFWSKVKKVVDKE